MKTIILLLILNLFHCLKANRSPFDINSPSGALGSGLAFSFDSASATNGNFTIGGSITGFTSGVLILQLNGGSDVSLSPTSSYQVGSVPTGATYSVTIKTNPSGLTCSVANGTGSATANVTNVDITCTAGLTGTSYTIAGTISGFTSGTLVLQLNGGGDVNLSPTSNFQLGSVSSGTSYSVTIKTNPSGFTCSVVNGTGSATANVTNVSITCSSLSYTIAGSVSGLTSGTLVLQNNGGNDLNISAGSNSFSFTSSLASGSTYLVTILTQPSGLTCSVGGGSGTISSNVNTVSVVCAITTYTIGGTITGLTSETLVLQNNGANDLSVSGSSTSFQFISPVTVGTTYSVRVKQHPTGFVCNLTNQSGTVTVNITNISVTCTTAVVIRHYTPPTETQWLHYIKRDGTTDYLTATNTACTGTEAGNYFWACINTAEIRKFDIPNETSCANFTVEDNLKAFYWNCKANTNSLTFYSTSLREGKFISDLIDWTTNPTAPDWNLMKLTVKLSGAAYAETSSTKWWSTPPTVTTITSGEISDLAGARLYVITSNITTPISTGYSFSTSNTALVVKPGVVITVNSSPTTYTLFSFPTANTAFFWIEGEFDANAKGRIVFNVSKNFTVLRNIKIKNIDGSAASNTAYGIYIISSKNYLHHINISNSLNLGGYAPHAIQLGDGLPAGDNILHGAMLANNSLNGIRLMNSSNSNNALIGITSFANTNGILNAAGGGPLTIFNVTSANNSAVGFASTSGLTDLYLQNFLSINNAGNGFQVSVPVNTNVTLTAQNLISQSNGTPPSLTNIYLQDFGAGSVSKFTGVFKVNTSSCSISNNSAGLDPATCRGFSPLSDYNKIFSENHPITDPLISATSSTFVGGGVTDISWVAAGITYATTLNWTNFTNLFRGVGNNPTSFPASARGRCTGSAPNLTCYLWDWSLQSGDSIAKNANLSTAGTGCPNGTSLSTITHSTTTFLRNTVEILGDGIGDDDGFCESNEDCLFTPNIGAYQGHGNLVSASLTTAGTSYTCPDIVTGGTIQNVKLYKYETNGY